MDGRGKISNKFLLIFPSFLCLLSTKLMAKWSRVPSQLSWGQKLSTKVNFDIFSSFQFSKIPQIFKYFCSCAFLPISANLDFIPINLHWFKGPPVQSWSFCWFEFTYFPLPFTVLTYWYERRVQMQREILVCLYPIRVDGRPLLTRESRWVIGFQWKGGETRV